MNRANRVGLGLLLVFIVVPVNVMAYEVLPFLQEEEFPAYFLLYFLGAFLLLVLPGDD
jgi:hypothetical protein